MHAKLLHSCPTLCDPMDYSPPGSSVYGILQARILEWVATLSSRGSSWPRDWTVISFVSCIGRPVLNQQCHLGSRSNSTYPRLVMYAKLEQLLEFLSDCKLESQMGKTPRPCIHSVGETSHCSFGGSCFLISGYKLTSSSICKQKFSSGFL